MNFNLISKAYQNLCPACEKGKIYKTYFEMNTECPQCQYLFKREAGFFVGSWIINYSFCTLLVMPLFLILLFADYGMGFSITVSLLIISILQVPLIPFVRKLWIHIYYQMSHAHLNS